MQENIEMKTSTFNFNFNMLRNIWLFLQFLVTVLCQENNCSCECSQNSVGEFIADCKPTKSDKIRKIPEFWNINISEINLSYQMIPELPSEVFINANLQNIRKIVMTRCQLQRLDKEALKNLSSLEIFNSPENNITEILLGTFDDNINLKKINFNSNNITELWNGLFDNLKHLKTLNFDHNRIDNIGDKLLIHNKKLEMLKLSYNNLKFIDGNVFGKQLQTNFKICIDDNPWECSCELWEFFNKTLKYIDNRRLPECENIRNTRSKKWNSLTQTDFVCPPSISLYKMEDKDKDTITVFCEVQANPGLTSLGWFQIESNAKLPIKSPSMESGTFRNVINITIEKNSVHKIYSCTTCQKGNKKLYEKNITVDVITNLVERGSKSFEENSSAMEQVITTNSEELSDLVSHLNADARLVWKIKDPKNVAWYFEEFLINEEIVINSEFKFNITDDSDGSVLIIRNVSQMDKGFYKCIASGKEVKHFNLRLSQTKELSADRISVVPKILGTSFVVLLIGFIITTYYLRKSEKRKNQSNIYEATDIVYTSEDTAERNELMVESSIYISSDNNIYEDIK